MDQFLAIEMHNQVVDLASETIVVVRDQRTIAAQVLAHQVRDHRAIVRPVIGQRVIGQRVPATGQPELDLRGRALDRWKPSRSPKRCSKEKNHCVPSPT